jgi:lipid-binding SYLF domain-containing protein
VIPDLKKAALIIGGEYGKGVMSCRAGDGWSAPIFLELAKDSWGFQAGAEEIDVVMLPPSTLADSRANFSSQHACILATSAPHAR